MHNSRPRAPAVVVVLFSALTSGRGSDRGLVEGEMQTIAGQARGFSLKTSSNLE